MGWSSGSDLFGTVAKILRDNIADAKARKKAYEKALAAFEDHDFDTQPECLGIDPILDELIIAEYSDGEKADVRAHIKETYYK
jgi:hypothetical protein